MASATPATCMSVGVLKYFTLKPRSSLPTASPDGLLLKVAPSGGILLANKEVQQGSIESKR